MSGHPESSRPAWAREYATKEKTHIFHHHKTQTNVLQRRGKLTTSQKLLKLLLPTTDLTKNTNCYHLESIYQLKKKNVSWASKMGQQVKALGVKSDDLSSNPRTHK